MNAGRSTVVGIVIVGATLFLSGVSFAEPGPMATPGHHQAQIKLLQDAAAALQQSQPALAKALSTYAGEEANEPAHKEGKEVDEAAEKEVEGSRAAHLKLLRDSAAALQVSRPDLAAQLTKSADRMVKNMKKDAKEDTKEAGEKTK